MVYQCLYPQIFPIFSHSPSPLASCPGASAQKVGHVRWFWEWSHSSRLGSVWVNPWERRPDRWDGHDAFEIQSESLKQIKCIIYIYIFNKYSTIIAYIYSTLYYCRLHWSHIECVLDKEEQNRIHLRAKLVLLFCNFSGLSSNHPPTQPSMI